MANTIRLNQEAPQDEWLNMNSGTTDTFLDLLVLAGSFLAETDAERELAVWLAEHDQNAVGDGAVGFDIADMPWQTAAFERQKQFLIRSADAAENGSFAGKLSYQPDMAYMRPYFRKFRDIVRKMTAELVKNENREEWIAAADGDDPVRNGFPCCERHGILLSTFGCRLCGRKRAGTAG